MKIIISTSLLVATTYAHMQLSNPYPIRSPLDPNSGSNADYSYTSPLSSSGTGTGSAYPCKGYQNDPFVSVATYMQGGQYSIGLAGSATHGGGSCQLSLSYNTGKSFTVINSIEGGCPLTSNYTFTIPVDAPTGQVLFAWSWFNKIGNREMYMDCAQVTIIGTINQRRAHDLVIARNTVAFGQRPPVFIANVDGPGGCTTIANEEVKFPLPGPDVQGTGATGPGFTCTGMADFLGSNPSNTFSTSSSTSSESASPFSAATGLNSGSNSGSGSNFAAGSSAISATPLGTLISNVPPLSGTGVAQAGAACSINGAITCAAGGSMFMVCDNGALVNMGYVAAGTTCQNGTIMR